MKELGFVVFMVCAVLVGCKTTKSHVQRSSLDSLSDSRAIVSSDFAAVSTRAHITDLQLDSSWTNALRLTNFNGLIQLIPTGWNIEGAADRAEIDIAGAMMKDERSRTVETDSLSTRAAVEMQSQTRVQKKEYDRQKEVEGVGMPWYIWLIVVGVVAFLLYGICRRIKSKLKLF